MSEITAYSVQPNEPGTNSILTVALHPSLFLAQRAKVRSRDSGARGLDLNPGPVTSLPVI